MKTIYCVLTGQTVVALFGIHQEPPQPQGYAVVALSDESPTPYLRWRIIGDMAFPPLPPAPSLETAVRDSYKARLRGRAATLSKQGLHAEAMNLLLRANEA